MGSKSSPCSAQWKMEVATMPLAMAKAGQRVHLVDMDVGHDLQARLTAMGLIPGVEIDVVRNSLHGPFIIAIKGCRVVLGRGMTQKIMVA